MDYSRDPLQKKADLLTGIVLGVCVTDGDSKSESEVVSITEGEGGKIVHVMTIPSSTAAAAKETTEQFLSAAEYYNAQCQKRKHAFMIQRVARVGLQIVNTARTLLRDEHETLMQLPPPSNGDNDDESNNNNNNNESDVEMLQKQMSRMGIHPSTEPNTNKKWTFYLIDTPIPNAFVSELMPHSIFVTTAMMDQFIENDDELALVLGHELSHLILGHSTLKNTIASVLGVVEVLLLSIDPTEGLISLSLLGGLGYLKKGIAAVHSRSHERDADVLGIELAARSCFDTHRAAYVFRKMAGEDNRVTAEGKAAVVTGFTDTHPPSMERYLELTRLSEVENSSKYRDTSCGIMRGGFKSALQFYLKGEG